MANLLEQLLVVKDCLGPQNHAPEADALQDVYDHCIAAPDFGGLGLVLGQELSPGQEAEVLFLVSAYLEGLNSADRQGALVTLSEKIFAVHDTARKGHVQPGDVIRVDVDWVISSELSWTVSPP